MIIIKNRAQLALMRIAGKISAQALLLGGEMVRPGVTTAQINAAIHKFIKSQNAIPSFLNYDGFPACACISIGEQVIHGIPGEREIRDGDIVSIDVGAVYKGFHGDNAATFPAGQISTEAKHLLEATRKALYSGIAAAQLQSRIGDISAAVELSARQDGLGIVRDFVGHGVGSELHEDPEIPNFGKAGHGPRLVQGMTLAIEPMLNLGTGEVIQKPDGWTIVTADGKLSAHFEHTIVVTDDGPVILTSA